MHRNVLILALALSACDPRTNPLANDDSDTENPEAQARAITSASPELASVIEGSNALGLSLLRLGAEDDDNAVLAPLGITAALGMTLGGARGDTATQLEAALGVSIDPATWHSELGALLADLDGDKGRAYTLGVANGAFGQEGFPFEAAYLDLTGTTYGAPLTGLDFVDDPDGSRDTINRWVKGETLDRVPELFPAGSIQTTTRLVLANAIALEAVWQHPFADDETANGTFHAPSGDVSVPFMHGSEGFRYVENDVAQVVVIPYEGEALSMAIVLPREDLGAVRSLDMSTVNGWIEAAEPQAGDVTLPRFAVEHALTLPALLEDLGVSDVFDPDLADLTGIASSEQGRLYVSGAFHGASITVDEAGTRAGAGTGVVVTADTGSEPFVFAADRPFLFVLRDDLTGAVLFLGQVANPS